MIGINYTPPGSGATAVDLGDFLDQLHTDVGYSTLQQALTAAAGETMLLCRDWTIGAALSVPAGTHVLGFGGSITANAVSFNALEVGGDGVTIEGVELIGPESSSEPPDVQHGSGVFAGSKRQLSVERCVIHGFSSCGIFFGNCHDVRIEANRIYDNRYNSPYAQFEVGDICVYSHEVCGRIIIANNFCLSNNSQGIYCNALGGDHDIAVTGNVCVATDAGGTEVEPGILRRRHGIVAGYHGASGSGRVTLSGNVVRNTNVTGIYATANGGHLRRAVVIANNIVSKVGFSGNTTGTAVPSLAGGIHLAGGGAGVIVSGNAIYDFRGLLAGDSGAITVAYTIAGATASIIGNTIDKSTAHGIVLARYTAGIRVAENEIRGSAYFDIYEVPDGPPDPMPDPPPNPLPADYGGHTIEDNLCVRANYEYSSIRIVCQSSTRTTFVRRNRLIGANGTTAALLDGNSGIFIQGSTAKPVVVEGNQIRNYYQAIVYYGQISGRFTNFRFDWNDIQGCDTGFVIAAAAPSACMVVEGNRFTGVARRFTVGGQGGYAVGYVGRLDNGRMVLLDLNAAPGPGIGNWEGGDRAEFTAPTAGGHIGAVCTTGGTPGTWNAYGAIAP